MTKEMKYGVLAIVGLLILAPLAFLTIKLGVLFLGAIFNYPATMLAVSIAFITGIFIGEKASK